MIDLQIVGAVGLIVMAYVLGKMFDLSRQVNCMHSTIHEIEEGVNAIGTIVMKHFFEDFMPSKDDEDLIQRKIQDWQAWENGEEE
jgi:hypothetical protein